MLKIKTRNGISVNVPETLSEDKSIKFTLNELKDAKNYY